MSQTTPRKYQSRGQQQQQQQQQVPSFSRSPHSNPHPHPHTQQQLSQLQHGHARNRSQQLRAQAAESQFGGATTAVASDYESDTAYYMASHPPPPAAALAARTNTELNLSVLRRYRPSITSILSIAAHAVVYVFTPPAKWDRSTVEGPLFICAQDEDGEAAAADGCLFILNRKGLQNLILDLSTVSNFELATDLLSFKLDQEGPQIPMENGESVRPKVIGMWIYAEDDQDRRTNSALINEMWSKARSAPDEAGGAPASPPTSGSAGDDVEDVSVAQGPGRQVSLNELFGRNQNGIGGP
ncbi:Dcp1-like decapping family protein [Daldinia childiae]|uniref:Dcp1-like decapping family protein n=1 Tax=Daldinia childiae TaxID=326645 RepID=UPI001446C1FE|nr:Dcp1-like decapping family protein [Daldinia childiae]KAF3063697.1 Dcp1-like decapping family protein [Daldinia childiae]